MNILHIASTYPPAIGGTATSTPALARELIKKGHHAVVLTRDAEGHPRYGTQDGIPVYRSPRIPGEFYRPPVAFLKSLAMGLEARRIIDKERIEVIHSHDVNVSAIAGIIGSGLKDVKKVTKFPGDLAWELLSLVKWRDEKPEEFFEKGDLSIAALERLQKIICNRYDRVIAPSKYMKKMLAKYSGVKKSRIEVVYNAIKAFTYSEEHIVNLRRELLGSSTHLVVSACRMVPWKGIDYLIDAFHSLPQDVRLVLIGGGPKREHFEKLASGLNINFIDSVPHSQVQAYLRASDVFVLPSIYEPSALALLDCLITQTPVIATKVGGTPEIIKHEKTGLLVKEKDPEAIAAAIERLLNDAALRENIKENQRRECRKYLWKNMIDRYIEVYSRMVS